MKKLILVFSLILNAAYAQDLTFDSVGFSSPLWGMKIEKGTVTDASMNCGSSNTNFVVGADYTLLRFPLNIANMGTSVAYFGTYGQNGITHDSCYSPAFTNPTDFINIPNFVVVYLLDSCNNVIASNRKTDWNIQNNSQFAMSYYAGNTSYLTNYLGLPPTYGNTPNPTKDWLQSYCPLDTQMAIYGKAQMDAYYRDCQICDSLVLFPNYMSNDNGVLQVPNNLGPGNYYLLVEGNFAPFEAGNCYPNSLKIPFDYSGLAGPVAVVPGPHSCTFVAPIQIPSEPTQVAASGSRTSGTVQVNWIPGDNTASSFIVTPYVVLSGNTERAVNTMARVVVGANTLFNMSDLKNAQEINAIMGLDKNTLKFRFKVKAENVAGYSAEVTSGNPAVQVK